LGAEVEAHGANVRALEAQAGVEWGSKLTAAEQRELSELTADHTRAKQNLNKTRGEKERVGWH
jgi:hypothetical protein